MPTPHAELWYGQPVNLQSRLLADAARELTIAPVDVAAVDGATLTLAELAALKRFASMTPTASHHKLLVITNVDQLSAPVANALLKLIEEPPSYLVLRLAAARAGAVLPTIRSRCQLAFVGHGYDASDRFTLSELRQRSISERFTVAQELATDEQLPEIVTGWLAELERELLQGHPVRASIAAALELVDRVRTNVNRRLALESWFLNHLSGEGSEG